MVFFADIETDTGEIVAVKRDKGLNHGKGLLAFHPASELYCMGRLTDDENGIEWFSRLNAHFNGRFCELMRPYLKSLYFIDEHEFVATEDAATEDQIKAVEEHSKNAWKDLQAVTQAIRLLISAFRELQPEETSWYNMDVLEAFETLQQILELLEGRRIAKIRIQIY